MSVYIFLGHPETIWS